MLDIITKGNEFILTNSSSKMDNLMLTFQPCFERVKYHRSCVSFRPSSVLLSKDQSHQIPSVVYCFQAEFLTGFKTRFKLLQLLQLSCVLLQPVPPTTEFIPMDSNRLLPSRFHSEHPKLFVLFSQSCMFCVSNEVMCAVFILSIVFSVQVKLQFMCCVFVLLYVTCSQSNPSTTMKPS